MVSILELSLPTGDIALLLCVCLCSIAVAVIAFQEGCSSHLWVQLCTAQKISCQVPPQSLHALVASAAAAAAGSNLFAAVLL